MDKIRSMSAMDRVLTALSHQEPDRVPLFLLFSMHGAHELNLSIADYFSAADAIVAGQIKLREKFGHDCYYTFTYASIETETWGGETIFFPDGPPNAAAPTIRSPQDIDQLTVPDLAAAAGVQRILHVTRQLHDHAAGAVPIIGVVMSPVSLPVMQMGFSAYLDLMMEDPARCAKLWATNAEFCVQWANAQLAAGATAICYFDPISSPTIIPPQTYHEQIFPLAQETLARINGPTATHFASGRALPILDAVAQTGTAVVGISSDEDLTTVKEVCHGRLTILGTLNGIAMRRWTAAEAETAVKNVIAQAGPGGGFLLAENHGEIPWQVTDETLFAVARAARKWGRYPLDWIDAA